MAAGLPQCIQRILGSATGAVPASSKVFSLSRITRECSKRHDGGQDSREREGRELKLLCRWHFSRVSYVALPSAYKLKSPSRSRRGQRAGGSGKTAIWKLEIFLAWPKNRSCHRESIKVAWVFYFICLRRSKSLKRRRQNFCFNFNGAGHKKAERHYNAFAYLKRIKNRAEKSPQRSVKPALYGHVTTTRFLTLPQPPSLPLLLLDKINKQKAHTMKLVKLFWRLSSKLKVHCAQRGGGVEWGKGGREGLKTAALKIQQ